MSTNDSQKLIEGPEQPDDPYKVSYVAYAVMIVIVGGIVIVILALLGPAVGNVFSQIVTGI